MRQSLLAICAAFISASPVLAQQSQPIGVSTTYPLPEPPVKASTPSVGRMSLIGKRQQRWQTAAVIGGVAGGAAFAALHAMFDGWNRNPNKNSMAHDIAIGVLGGAVTAGGTVAFHDWMCAPGSGSDNAGLCTGLPRRRFPDGMHFGKMRGR